jgi:hypothetical protein
MLPPKAPEPVDVEAQSLEEKPALLAHGLRLSLESESSSRALKNLTWQRKPLRRSWPMPQETELLYLVLLVVLTLIIDLILEWTTPKPKASSHVH